MIIENRHITISMLSTTLGTSVGCIETILKDHLLLRKICAKWVPHKLTKHQKNERVRIQKEILAMFPPHGRKRLSDVITGDESWLNFYTERRKHDNYI